MKIKLSVELPNGRLTTIAVTAEGTATIADLASTLWAGIYQTPADPASLMTLQVVDYHQELATLPARSLVGETSLRSGQRVRIAPARSVGPGAGGSLTAARLRVVSGPMAGKSFALCLGSHLIGRDRACDIVLDDSQVSRRHARLTVGEWQHNLNDFDAHGRIGAAEQAKARVEAGGTAGDGQAILHGPDQVAGGRNEFDGLGSSRINSSIGSQWRTRIDQPLEDVREAMVGVPKELQRFIHLNMQLVP